MKFTEEALIRITVSAPPGCRATAWPLKSRHSKAGTPAPTRVPASRIPSAVSLTEELPWSHYLLIYQHWQHC